MPRAQRAQTPIAFKGKGGCESESRKNPFRPGHAGSPAEGEQEGHRRPEDGVCKLSTTWSPRAKRGGTNTEEHKAPPTQKQRPKGMGGHVSRHPPHWSPGGPHKGPQHKPHKSRQLMHHELGCSCTLNSEASARKESSELAARAPQVKAAHHHELGCPCISI